jgi:hypothetical protein
MGQWCQVGWTGAEEAGAPERETAGGRGPETLGCDSRCPVGIEDKPRPGGVVAVAALGRRRDRLSGGGLAAGAPEGHTDVEGISAPREEGCHQGGNVVGRTATRGAVAAWAWRAPLGGRGKWDRRRTVTCRRAGSRARGGHAAVDACGAVPCYKDRRSNSSKLGRGGGGNCTDDARVAY